MLRASQAICGGGHVVRQVSIFRKKDRPALPADFQADIDIIRMAVPMPPPRRDPETERSKRRFAQEVLPFIHKIDAKLRVAALR